MNNIHIHQIFYDNFSRSAVDPNFIPLDNTKGPSDWFEFYPILNFLENTKLEDDHWYGFLSPKFSMKTGVPSSQLINIISQYSAHANAALFSPAWDQLAYFKNPFEQGEFRHPGLLEISQAFLDETTYKVDLKKLVTYSSTAVYSNFIIAKPDYWKSWLVLARQFNRFAEKNEIGETSYLDSKIKMGPMKTFIQERFPSIILSQGSFKVLAMDFSQSGQIFDQLFENSLRTRKMLQTCDLMKEKYATTLDPTYLQMYLKIRKEINLKQPNPSEHFFL